MNSSNPQPPSLKAKTQLGAGGVVTSADVALGFEEQECRAGLGLQPVPAFLRAGFGVEGLGFR